MKRIARIQHWKLFIGVVLFIFQGAQLLWAQSPHTTFQVEGHVVDVNDLNQKIDQILVEASLPGLSLAVIDKNEVVFYNTYGYKKFKRTADGRHIGKGRVNRKTVFEACSLSKSFFVYAVHTLVDRGLLNLDTPLYHYLEHPRLGHDARYKKITGRMVLAHSSGLENWQVNNDADTLEIVNEPGERFTYSGEGYVYLATIVEKLLDEKTQSYMRQLVYTPLHLRRTFTSYSKNKLKPGNYATGHNPFLDPFPKMKNTTPNIAGGISTTAEDYAKLLIGIFGSKNLSQARISDITAPHIPYAENLYYGAGFSVFYEKGDTLVFQDGNNGQFKGFGGYNLTKQSGLVIFINGERGDQIRTILTELIFNVKESVEDVSQYPNVVLEILKVYNEQGYTSAYVKFNTVLTQKKEQFSTYELEELKHLFVEKEPGFSAYITRVIEDR